MATATRDVPEHPDIILRLTWQEARVLFSLTGDIAGPEDHFVRQATDSIYEALERAGVDGIDAENYIDWESSPQVRDPRD